MNNLISKLNTLKSIKPEESWVVETRKRVLSEAPVLDWKVTEMRNKQENRVADRFLSKRCRDEALPRFYGGDVINRVYAALFSKRLAVSMFALVFVVSGGAFTVEASKSSLPGDSLYIVKIASEDVTLAVAPKEKRPEIEIGHAGKRLEELSEISKKSSDSDQSKKTERLLASFEKKVNNAQNGLTEIEDNSAKARIARVINTQTEKYTEVLAETKENLPDVVKDEVLLEKFASVAESNEKVNFQSLAIMVETIDENEEEKEEITAKVKEKIDKLEEKIIINSENEDDAKMKDNEEVESDNKNDNTEKADNTEELTDITDESNDDTEEDSEDLTSEPKTATEKAKEDIEKAKISLESDNLSEAMKTITNVNITVNLKDSEPEPDPAGNEQTEDGSHGDEGDEVESASDEGEDLEINSADETHPEL
ncbi:MAG: hypothetical protein DRG30_00410 [Epsilonproteobacteria bacterium]|nr:MAG: hypothetical protein DRG30_00410 [Campylobacterota bacterium]